MSANQRTHPTWRHSGEAARAAKLGYHDRRALIENGVSLDETMNTYDVEGSAQNGNSMKWSPSTEDVEYTLRHIVLYSLVGFHVVLVVHCIGCVGLLSSNGYSMAITR